jgi:hypothetical protein
MKCRRASKLAMKTWSVEYVVYFRKRVALVFSKFPAVGSGYIYNYSGRGVG